MTFCYVKCSKGLNNLKMTEKFYGGYVVCAYLIPLLLTCFFFLPPDRSAFQRLFRKICKNSSKFGVAVQQWRNKFLEQHPVWHSLLYKDWKLLIHKLLRRKWMKLMPNTFLTHLVSSNCRKLNERTAQDNFVDHVLELEYVLHLTSWRESISVLLFRMDTKLWTMWMCHFLHKVE